MLNNTIADLKELVKKPLALIILGVFGLVFLITVGTYLAFVGDLSSKDKIMSHNDQGVILTDRNDTPFFTFYQSKSQKIVPLSDIPPSMQHAVIAIEDKDFYIHQGFSIKGIFRSLVANVKQNELAQGGSTITQQLVKNTLLTPQKNFLRKYQEILLAYEIERRYKKDEILEMYLNSVYFGEGAFGIEEAAEIYFGKQAKDLNLAESTILAGILPAPSAYSPLSNPPEKAQSRQKLVLEQMVEQKYITSQQKDEALKTPLSFKRVNGQQLNVNAPHFALMVRDELIQKYGEEYIIRSGFKVKTTLDLTWQKYAEQVVKNQVAALAGNKVTNGAAVAMDVKTGEIRALVGSKDWSNDIFGKVNIITSKRQPGSSFKPIVYAAAFEKKTITPATVLTDEPTTFEGNYKPLDYDRKFRGKVLARRALANSLNIPAVDVMSRIGVPTALNMADRLGISTLSDASQYGLSLVLGSGEVKPLELTEAYATFANEGYKNKPADILEIKDKENNTIYKYTPSPYKVIESDVSFLISSILSDNVTRAEEFGNALTISRPAAVKTGTTDNYKDAWTVGYTPSLAVGVWVGNNDGKPMDQIAGSLGAAPIWRLLMERFLQGTPVEKFVPPNSVMSESICKDKGLLVNQATSSAMTEFFINGTAPTQLCYGSQPITSVTASPNQETPTPRPDNNQPTPTNSPTTTPASTATPKPTEKPKEIIIQVNPSPTSAATTSPTP